jgi:citrate synthase
MGFGHRVYKNYDPRAKLMRETCTRCCKPPACRTTRCSSWRWRWKRSRSKTSTSSRASCIPNVDFYSGIVQSALGIPVTLFTAIFALGPTVAGSPRLNEMIGDPEYKIGARVSCTRVNPARGQAIADR